MCRKVQKSHDWIEWHAIPHNCDFLWKFSFENRNLHFATTSVVWIVSSLNVIFLSIFYYLFVRWIWRTARAHRSIWYAYAAILQEHFGERFPVGGSRKGKPFKSTFDRNHCWVVSQHSNVRWRRQWSFTSFGLSSSEFDTFEWFTLDLLQLEFCR